MSSWRQMRWRVLSTPVDRCFVLIHWALMNGEEVGAIVAPILQMRRLKHRAVKWCLFTKVLCLEIPGSQWFLRLRSIQNHFTLFSFTEGRRRRKERLGIQEYKWLTGQMANRNVIPLSVTRGFQALCKNFYQIKTKQVIFIRINVSLVQRNELSSSDDLWGQST